MARKLENTKSGKEAISEVQKSITSDNIESAILSLGDLPLELQAALNEHIKVDMQSRMVDMFNILLINPHIAPKELCEKAKIGQNTYYGKLMTIEPIKKYIIEFRRIKIFDDVVSSYEVIVKLTRHANPSIAFNAAKFILENNGQLLGFGKKEEQNATNGKLQIEDKRDTKPTYTAEELEDV
jgi:hypothetical protein